MAGCRALPSPDQPLCSRVTWCHHSITHYVPAPVSRPEYCTGSADGTLRIWSLATHQQLFEFHAPGEVVTCVAYHPTLYEIAAGFQNGRVRVFDVATTTLVQVRVSVCVLGHLMHGAAGCLIAVKHHTWRWVATVVRSRQQGTGLRAC